VLTLKPWISRKRNIDPMKHLLLFFLVAAWSAAGFANCNYGLAEASGKYLVELEKAKLRKYQNNSVCEVLDQEIANCSADQIKKLKNTYDVDEVRGNYCQPHLPPYQSTDREQFMKGADLFSWQEDEGYIWFAIFPGTNRLKTTKEITNSKISYSHLREKLTHLPANTQISWNNLGSIDDKQKLNFSIPNKKTVERLREIASESKLTLLIPPQ
jgi:hypothetical protein